MKLKIKNIIFVLYLSMGILHATVEDYQVIYQEEQKAFNQQMQKEIKKSVTVSSKKVQELYRAIDYMPVWVDKDYLTQYCELLVHELQEDFDKGLYKELVSTYKKLLPDDNNVFTSDSLADRVEVELGVMQLYVDHINAILKDKKSKFTALSLLQFALKEKSLTHALNAISEERISCRTALVDVNTTILKESEKIDKESLRMLASDDKKERLNTMYALLNFQPVWITTAGFSSYTKSLFKQIKNDITFDRNS